VQETAKQTRIVRFGVYEVDLRSGELRKNGLKLKLRGQPFQVLAVLLKRPSLLRRAMFVSPTVSLMPGDGRANLAKSCAPSWR
jgi:DNA-binding response OmpR family regulator